MTSSPTSSAVHSVTCGSMAPSASSPPTRSLKATHEMDGLEEICRQGGEIFSVRKRFTWPGQAGSDRQHCSHYERWDATPPRSSMAWSWTRSPRSSFLGRRDSSPLRLAANEGSFFLGSYIYGHGLPLRRCRSRRHIQFPCIAEIDAHDPGSSKRDLPVHRRRGGQRLVLFSFPIVRSSTSSDLTAKQSSSAIRSLRRSCARRSSRFGTVLARTRVTAPLKRRWWAYRSASSEPSTSACSQRVRVLVDLSCEPSTFAFTFLPHRLVSTHDSLALVRHPISRALRGSAESGSRGLGALLQLVVT